jgi:hypothetical protein
MSSIRGKKPMKKYLIIIFLIAISACSSAPTFTPTTTSGIACKKLCDTNFEECLGVKDS